MKLASRIVRDGGSACSVYFAIDTIQITKNFFLEKDNLFEPR
jgi:hypothetical protein